MCCTWMGCCCLFCFLANQKRQRNSRQRARIRKPAGGGEGPGEGGGAGEATPLAEDPLSPGKQMLPTLSFVRQAFVDTTT